MSKYHNRRAVYKGMSFDSIGEMNRYKELELMQMAGVISELKHAVRFKLLPAQKGELRNEKGVVYIADFTYKRNGTSVVEDYKGKRTDVYILKRKMMKYFYGVEILETPGNLKTYKRRK